MRDGHIHTPFCPHGTKDKMGDYVAQAIKLGYEEITFTEHAPLPEGFVDPVPAKDSAMNATDLEDYFKEIEELKIKYKDTIRINVGFEVDFIEGYEKQTKLFLNQVGHRIDDAILSVHFLRLNNQYECIDYSPDNFAEMVTHYGSVEAVYKKYFETVKLSLLADLGEYKPKRIGHITLARKFHKKYPANENFEKEIIEILQIVKEKGYELDYNGAGTAKPLCREPYPPLWVIEKAKELQIPLVYGSDAHQVKELNQGRDQIRL